MSLDKLYETLGFNQNNGLHKHGEELPNYPSRIKVTLKKIDYDAIYNIENKPLIIFKELNRSNDLEKKIESLHRDVWNLGETPILFIVLNNEYRLYNSFIFDKEKNDIWKKITNDNDLEEFSFLNIASGKLLMKYEKDFDGKKRVQEYLLRNLRDARKILYGEGLSYHTINNLIGRLLFSRYLIDREILKKENFEKIYKKSFEDIILSKRNLYEYFKYLKEKFNGDLFPITSNEKKEVDGTHLKTLSDLFKGYNLANGQTVLFDIYDFSIIPIELISSIYETFLEKKEKKTKGVFYTPLSLVDYILNHTLDPKLEKTDQCKILDPACGSGVFLVESLRKIIEKKIENDSLDSEDLKEIVQSNIFGIDADEDAINISIFSIYLTLLDYLNSDNANKFRFPELKNKNLFISDFFDTENKFNNIIKNVSIDLIIGNPPWGNSKGLNIKYSKKEGFKVGNNQIAQSFLIRVKDFVNENTKIALIVTSKVLYNLQSKNFRSYFLEKFFIDEILEFSAVRRKNVFKNAIGPGAIIFYRFAHNQDTKNNNVQHITLKSNRFFNLFKIIVIEKYDIKYIKQEYFLKYDWLWKVVLYGNILDFNFIKRLKEEYKPIKEIVDHKKSLLDGVGISTGGQGKLKDISDLKGTPYLDISREKDMLKRYFIDNKKDSLWDISTAVKLNRELFEPPYLLMRIRLDRDFRCVASFSEEKMVFRSYVSCIKGSNKDKRILKNILGVLNSQLFTYYMTLTGSATGIERPDAYHKEKLAFPIPKSIIKDEKIYRNVNTLLNLYKEYSSFNIPEKALRIEKRLDEHIFNLFELDVVERDLIDYTSKISIPLINEEETPLNAPKEDQLKDYAKIFLEHFKHSFAPHFFSIEIYNTDYFIGMNFKIVPNEPKEFITFKKENDLKKIINKLGIISIEKIGEIYVQRDIKEFSKSSFSIIKPCEYKNWHKAVAWLDLGEFLDAMFQNYIKEKEVAQ